MATHTPFIRFTYTVLNPNGLPQQSSWIVNCSYIVSIEANASNDLKLFLTNNQMITVNLGSHLDANSIMNEILQMSAAGLEYSVYNIDAIEK